MLPRLLSLHIPKSGGKTFWKILETIYGDRNVRHIRKDIPHLGVRTEPTDPEDFFVLHGHFTDITFLHLQWPTIIWFRNPIDRIISSYYFQLRKNWSLTKDRQQRRLHNEKLTLLEYACMKGSEVADFYLTESTPKDFAFVGITEHYEDSLRRFSTFIGRPVDFPYDCFNVQNDKPFVDTDTRKEIARFVKDDIPIYVEACKVAGVELPSANLLPRTIK